MKKTIIISFIIIMFNQLSYSDEILPITPVNNIPEFSDLSDDQDGCFVNYGSINRIENFEIVIDDCLYKLSNLTTFYTKKGRIWDRSIFNKGNIVRFTLDSPDQIASIWFVN